MLNRVWTRFRGLRTIWQLVIVGVVIIVLISAIAAPAEDEPDEVDTAGETSTTDAPEDDDEDGEDEETTTSRRPTTTEPTTTTTTQPPVPSFDDGTHRVGEDIQPGIYRNGEVGSGCYWARLAGFGGDIDDIIANDNATGSAVVEIVATDEGFESRRCGEWRMDTSRITDSTTMFGEGTFITNTDFEPGQWRNSGGDGCYWARLANFRGDMGSIIANNNVDGQTVVDISSTDAGFTSRRCGTWEKIG